jgi:hypothetical protein
MDFKPQQLLEDSYAFSHYNPSSSFNPQPLTANLPNFMNNVHSNDWEVENFDRLLMFNEYVSQISPQNPKQQTHQTHKIFSSLSYEKPADDHSSSTEVSPELSPDAEPQRLSMDIHSINHNFDHHGRKKKKRKLDKEDPDYYRFQWTTYCQNGWAKIYNSDYEEMCAYSVYFVKF